jgi:hypothetical protein
VQVDPALQSGVGLLETASDEDGKITDRLDNKSMAEVKIVADERLFI